MASLQNSESTENRKRKSSALSRNVVAEANKVLPKVRKRAFYLTLLRFLSRLPHHGALLRSVDTLRVNLSGVGIGASGFRLH